MEVQISGCFLLYCCCNLIFACPLQCGKTMLHGFCRWKNSICSWVSHRRHNISSIVLPKLSRVTVGFHILLFSYAALHYPAKRLRMESDITALPPFFRRKVEPKNLKQKNSLSGSEWDLALPEFLPANFIIHQKSHYVNTVHFHHELWHLNK